MSAVEHIYFPSKLKSFYRKLLHTSLARVVTLWKNVELLQNGAHTHRLTSNKKTQEGDRERARRDNAQLKQHVKG